MGLKTLMTTVTLVTLVVTTCLLAVEGVENLLRNPSFENQLNDEWVSNRFTMEQYSGDSVDGRVSLRCTNRDRDTAGPSQVLPPLKPGRGYALSARVKLLNGNPEKLFQKWKATVDFNFVGENVERPAKIPKGKPKSCKGTKGKERSECLARRREWKAAIKKRKEEKKRRQEEKRRKKEERKRKKEEKKRRNKEKKKREKEKAKDKKNKDKAKEKKKKGRAKEKKKRDQEKEKKERAKEKERQRKERAKEKERQRKEREREKERQRREREKNNKKSASGREVTPAAGDTSASQPMTARRSSITARGLSPALALRRRRRQVRRERVEPPLRSGRFARSSSSGDSVLEHSSGTEEEVGTYIIAWRSWATPEDGWMSLEGSISAPMIPFNKSTLRIRGPDAGVDFLVDNVTFYEIPDRVDWRAESFERINTFRKNDIRLRVKIPRNVNRSEVDIQVRLTNHLFAFGSKVEDDLLRPVKKNQDFQDLFFYMFNWATLGSFKWRFDKGRNLYSPDFSNAFDALDVLHNKGVKVRCHSILWGVEKNIPEAVLATPPEQLVDLLRFRTQYVMNSTRGKIEHVDIQNELLHGRWYEETLQDPYISQTIFKEALRMDPTVQLYLNDFTAVTSGANTEDYHDMAIRFIRANTGIRGLGIQGHVKDFVKPNPSMMWRNLDRLSETGLELFMTEFDLGWNDNVVRADWFEDTLRAFFAHPGLGGVILWGFWRERQRYKNKYLVYGEDMKFAEPGERYVCLVKKEWTTNEKFNLARQSTFTVRGFHGDYEVIVRKRGVPVQRETFTLGKRNMVFNMDVTQSNEPIELAEEHDYVPQCISHRDQKSLGVLNSTTSDPTLTCLDMTSGSSFASAGPLAVTCPEGTVMTSCSSYHMSRSSSSWRGEQIRMERGKPVCTAPDPYRRGEVRVTARCCQQAGLTCDYRQAGPSSPIKGAMAEANCPQGFRALGCSATSQYSGIEGAFVADHELTSCRAQNGAHLSSRETDISGVVSTAACCSSPSLSCRVVKSSPGSADVTVQCPVGDVMTGCQAHAEDGGTAGAELYTGGNQLSTCRAFLAGEPSSDMTSVVAIATCCSGAASAE